jgi:hypothetical protein
MIFVKKGYKKIWVPIFLYRFSTNFYNIISKLSTFCNGNVLEKENLKSIDLVLQGAKKVFTSLQIINYINLCIPSTPNIVDAKL